MKKNDEWAMGTKCIHAGEKCNETHSHTMPIYMTSSFSFDTREEAERKFDPVNPEQGYVYSRMGNPNVSSLERKIASLYNTEEALVFSSGMAAIDTVFRTFLEPGDHVICSRTLYGCTHQLISGKDHLLKFNIDIDFADSRGVANVLLLLSPGTKIVYLETLSNPTLELANLRDLIPRLKEYFSFYSLYIVVDNTFAGPYNVNPLELGADMVIDSCTKYLNGHGDLILGSVVGRKELINRVLKWRMHAGAMPDPFKCWLAARGLKTYVLRMERHNENARLLAKALEGHPMIEKVIYPGLQSYLQHDLAKKIMPRGFGGVISLEIKGGIENTEKFLREATKEKIFSFAVSLGCVDTLIQHPASMTHAGVPKEERLKRGVTDKLLRLSVGIEDYGDILSAFLRVLSKI